MRTALCLSGNMRTYAQTYENLKRNIIDPNNCDIFIATWDVLGNAKHDKHATKDFQEPVSSEQIQSTYGENLKNLKIFNFNTTQPSLPKIFYPGMVSMYWQIYQADLLRQQYEEASGFKYDCIIRARPDHLFHTGIQMKDPASIGNFIWVKHVNEYMVDDTFAFGSNIAMTYYSNLFNQLEFFSKCMDLFKIHPEYNCVCWPEQTLLLYIQRSSFKFKTIHIEYQIFRGDFTPAYQ